MSDKLETADCKAKQSEMWDIGTIVTHLWVPLTL